MKKSYISVEITSRLHVLFLICSTTLAVIKALQKIKKNTNNTDHFLFKITTDTQRKVPVINVRLESLRTNHKEMITAVSPALRIDYSGTID